MFRLAGADAETSVLRVARLFVRFGITRRTTVVSARQAREATARARAEWREKMTAPAPGKRVLIDEPKVRAAKAASTLDGTALWARGPDGHWRIARAPPVWG